MGIKYKIDNSFFKNWTNKMAYVLGFVYADGSLEDAPYLRGKYLRICSRDKEILKKIKTVMGSEHKIVTVNSRPCVIRNQRYISKEQYYVRIGSHEIFDDLVGLGVTPHKSKTIGMPQVPLKLLPDFIRGYLDGDGCINVYKKKKRLSVTFTSGSKLFLDQLSRAIGVTLGLKAHNVFENKNAFQIKYSTREATPLLAFLYADCNSELFLERKHSIFSGFIEDYPNYKRLCGDVPKWLRELSAKQLYTGSSPVVALN